MGPNLSAAATAAPDRNRKTAARSAALLLAIAAVLALGVLWLIATNPVGISWAQGYDPLHRWWLSTIFAALPIVVLLGAMAILRVRAHLAACAGLLTVLAVAIAIFHMPARMALTAAAYGAGYGLFPICWIILPVIFLYDLTVKSGRFAALQQSLVNVTSDSRLQLLLIAFALGAFFESTSGFGAPVAVCGAILITLGFRPLDVAVLCLFANTAPVAFGSLGIPLIALHGVTVLGLAAITRTTAILLAGFCILIPFWMIWIFAGFRAMVEVWPAILTAGAAFAIVQALMAFASGPTLAGIVAALASIACLVVFLRFWRPRRILNAQQQQSAEDASRQADRNSAAAARAWMPWLILSLVVFLWGLPRFSKWAGRATTLSFHVRGLDLAIRRIPPVVAKPTAEAAIFTFNWFTATGTGIFLAAIFAGLLMGFRPVALARTFLNTLVHIRFAIITIAAMLAIGYVTRYCGLDAAMGLAFARTGRLYPFFGALIGWLGVATSGSDTASNVLFGSLQQMTARQIGVAPVLMASTNSVGGVMGKMIAAPSVVIASTATQTYGQEGTILRRVFLHSLALACLVGVLTYLMAYVPPFTSLVAR